MFYVLDVRWVPVTFLCLLACVGWGIWLSRCDEIAEFLFDLIKWSGSRNCCGDKFGIKIPHSFRCDSFFGWGWSLHRWVHRSPMCALCDVTNVRSKIIQSKVGISDVAGKVVPMMCYKDVARGTLRFRGHKTMKILFEAGKGRVLSHQLLNTNDTYCFNTLISVVQLIAMTYFTSINCIYTCVHEVACLQNFVRNFRWHKLNQLARLNMKYLKFYK